MGKHNVNGKLQDHIDAEKQTKMTGNDNYKQNIKIAK
jgi:hypothetical protein